MSEELPNHDEGSPFEEGDPVFRKIDEANEQEERELEALDQEKEVIAKRMGITVEELGEVVLNDIEFLKDEGTGVCNGIKYIGEAEIDERTESLLKSLIAKMELIILERSKTVAMLTTGYYDEKYYKGTVYAFNHILDVENAINN